jgi:hypothetical protein
LNYFPLICWLRQMGNDNLIKIWKLVFNEKKKHDMLKNSIQ